MYKKDSEETPIHKIVTMCNAVDDLMWVGDFEGVRETLKEIIKVRGVDEFINEEEKWRKILNEIKQKLRGIPKKEREEKKDLMLREKCMEVDANKIIVGTILKELYKLREIISISTLTFFFEQTQKPVKEKAYTYLILEKTEREFEVRALLKKTPKREVIENLLKRAKEEWGYVASEPYIGTFSFSVELYSSTSYIEIRYLHPRLLMLLSFHQPPKPDEVNSHVKIILKTLTQT